MSEKKGISTKMKNVLIFGMNDNSGGIESFLMNYIRRMQGKEIQFDFLCNTEVVAYEDELRKLNCKITKITARSVNAKEYQLELKEFFDKYAKTYQVIWVNVCSLANIDYLKFAKKYGIPKRIIHSHNSQNMDSKLRGILHWLNRFVIEKYATDFWACSEGAGKWFYNEKIRNKPSYRIIHNAIDVHHYEFSKENRVLYRKKMNISEKTVIGNIGRLHFQKNQMFLIDIFKEYKKLNENSCLLLIGQGEDEIKLRQHVKELNLENDVSFLGIRKDIPQLLSAMDIFVFPSLFEGLSLVSLEVQASGILMFASEQIIPEEIRISDLLYTLSLDNGASYWAESIEKKRRQICANETRKSYLDIFERNGYSIEQEVLKLQKLLEV